MKEWMLHEYWETCDGCQGGAIVAIDEEGLCINSPADMPVGGELKIKMFFSIGGIFDEIGLSARIVDKDIRCEGDWEAFEYKLEFIKISEEGRLKLKGHLGIRRGNGKPAFLTS